MMDERGERLERLRVLLNSLTREIDVLITEHEEANAPRQPIKVATHDGSTPPWEIDPDDVAHNNHVLYGDDPPSRPVSE